MSEKYVYFFGKDQSEGKKEMKEMLGGKGANLAEMASLNVPVPPGFTITTEVCNLYYENGKKHTAEILKQIQEKLEQLEKTLNKKLGDKEDPLLVSVRSGAAVSMPGMMDTVLNLGLNDESVIGLANKSGNERFAYDSYRRFLQMFGDVVMNVSHSKFEAILHKMKEDKNVKFDTDLTTEDLKELVIKYKEMVKQELGKPFPQDPNEQLQMSIDAVFGSWNNDRAIYYRKINDIKGLLGTAVNVQAMVYGNLGETSGTGVCFSRNPSTGENKFYGEYLMNAQGEDVVAGIRTPQPIETLNDVMPNAYKELVEIKNNLEKHYKDMQDMEFTIQDKVLYILQTRNGKRTAQAAVTMAVDMFEENLIDDKTAILRVDPYQVNQLLHPQLAANAKDNVEAIAKGLPASPGAAVGKIVFDSHVAAEWVTERGEIVILVRNETSPEDLIGMDAAKGILTARGGMTSHAAVVARGMGKCCIAGCSELNINETSKTLKVGETILNEGDFITLDGTTGEVFKGKLEVVEPSLEGNFGKLMELADKYRTLKIRTNADTPKDAAVAVKFGAEGIGLCRTEHMFFEGDRINAMREMILAKDVESRENALAKILPFQKADFKGLFETLNGKPVTIRLLDPPLHEFLPHEEADKKTIAEAVGITVEDINYKIEQLHEVNPMMGHRGCRLGIVYPEITKMQVRAIMEAAVEVRKEKNINVIPEIMIPLVGNVNEFKDQKAVALETISKVFEETGEEFKYMIGTMIEVPRGALTADLIAKEAEFFSFGTNDLTQMTFGFSRDDVAKFVKQYIEKGIIEKDPFQVLDQEGVGQLIKTAVEKGKSARPDIKLGICGEHGGEPSSVEFCHKVGLNYVSCSPYRVPVARLAAAHAALKNNK